MVDVDALIQRARGATVRREVAEAYVRELERWTSRRKPHTWPAWVLAAAATAATAAVVLVLRARGTEPAPVRIGDRVAIVVEPGTSYRIVRASPDDTAIEVEHGEVTARLWPGAGAYHLALQGGGMVATATGTVYSLAVERGTGEVHVDEGMVEVRVGAVVHRVPAGASWPPDRVRAPGPRRAPTLLTLAPPAAAATPSAIPAPSSPAATASGAAAPTAVASSDPASTTAAPPGSGSPAAASGSGSPAAPGPGGSGSPTAVGSLSRSGSTATAASPGSGSTVAAASPGSGSTVAASSGSGARTAIASPQGPGSPTGAGSPRPHSRATVVAPPAVDATPPRATVDATQPPRATLDRRGPAASLAIKERWRFARRLRAEGKFRAAIAECLAIADLGDATWSSIALVEAIRLYAGPLADPAHAIETADRVIRDWPADVLAPEARQLRCRALARLGRGGECAPPPTP